MSDATPAHEASLRLREQLAVLRYRKWSIVAVVGLAVVAAIVLTSLRTPLYSSKARVLVKPINSTDQTVPADLRATMATEKQVVESGPVAKLAVAKMIAAAQKAKPAPPDHKTKPATAAPKGEGKPAVPTRTSKRGAGPAKQPNPRLYLAHLSVNVPPSTQVLEITYSDPVPIVAQRRAQAFAEAYLQYKTNQALKAYADVQASFQKEIGKLQARLNRIPEELATLPPGSPERQSLVSQAGLLQNRIAVLQNGVTPQPLNISPGEILESANLPVSPSGPDYKKNVLLALFLGLALGLGWAFLRDQLDDRIRHRVELEDRAGAPVLAVIPKVSGWKDRTTPKLVTVEEPMGPASEAYRTLRTNVLFLAAQRDVRTIMVTSPLSGEGKTTTAANLAVSLAEAGKRPIVISADLRKPRIHRFFGVRNMDGLVQVLSETVLPQDAVQEAHGVRVLPSGAVPSRPGELIEKTPTRDLLAELRTTADFLIIDAPPVLVVSDALPLAPLVDGVLLVADAASTGGTAVSQAREQLEQVGATIVGTVLNRFDPSRARGYPAYVYRYRYVYAYVPEAVEPNGNGQHKGPELPAALGPSGTGEGDRTPT